MDKENLKPPKKDTVNKIHEYINEYTKTLTGGLINPLVDYILPSFHQKLFEKWCEDVYQAIIELEEEKISKKVLLNDVEFISLLKESVVIASKTHQKEKHEILKRALINHFDNITTFDSKIMFTRLIDTLTLSHLSLLSLLNKYSEGIGNINEFSKIIELFKEDILMKTIPTNSHRMLLHDLESLNLIAIGAMKFEVLVRQPFGLSAGGENTDLPYILVTNFGKEFIEYIMNE